MTEPDFVPETESAIDANEQGYRRHLTPRQVAMIGMGGAIGTGLFLGAGGRLHQAGPALAISYVICGLFAFLVLRALGELISYRPSSGSFVSYTREFFGENWAFAIGWIYWLNWVVITVIDSTAVAMYLTYFGKYVPAMAAVPQWVYALTTVALVVLLNLISVKVFGELEFWFSLIKILALSAFLILGVALLAIGHPVAGQTPGLSLIGANGGFFPVGVAPALVLVQGVVFAYGSIELIGTASGEAQHPERTIPRAINAVVTRIVVFYVGSIVVLSLLLPYTAYSAGTSPFVTFFASIGLTGADGVMNLIVLTAALSSLNAGLYSTGRTMRSLAAGGSAPQFTVKMTKSGVPWGGLLMTAGAAMLGTLLNYVIPAAAFEIALNVDAIILLAIWTSIIACHIRLRTLTARGEISPPAFRMPAAPFTAWATLGFFAIVLILMLFDTNGIGRSTVLWSLLLIPLLVCGWTITRPRIASNNAARLTRRTCTTHLANNEVRMPPI
ncbi:amino acid permease [Mycobacteroides chelonae]|uniref:amino acid permease n=1 Tax=Mycobacteroides chelonae TaxID=1774 RepID=UPI0008A9AB66|nr:amino acid permease [Mycobacteroides chelonae]OHU64967.1 L-asparagine permease [Mycobacteroides chelonae]